MKTAHISLKNHCTIAFAVSSWYTLIFRNLSLQAISSTFRKKKYQNTTYYRFSSLTSSMKQLAAMGNSNDRCFRANYTFMWKSRSIHICRSNGIAKMSSSKCSGMFCDADGRGIFNLSALCAHKLLEQQELDQILLQLTIFQKYRAFEKIRTFA